MYRQSMHDLWNYGFIFFLPIMTPTHLISLILSHEPASEDTGPGDPQKQAPR